MACRAPGGHPRGHPGVCRLGVRETVRRAQDGGPGRRPASVRFGRPVPCPLARPPSPSSRWASPPVCRTPGRGLCLFHPLALPPPPCSLPGHPVLTRRGPTLSDPSVSPRLGLAVTAPFSSAVSAASSLSPIWWSSARRTRPICGRLWRTSSVTTVSGSPSSWLIPSQRTTFWPCTRGGRVRSLCRSRLTATLCSCAVS